MRKVLPNTCPFTSICISPDLDEKIRLPQCVDLTTFLSHQHGSIASVSQPGNSHILS